MSGPNWPIGERSGLECCYCPICRDAEPDGLPNVEAFEVTDRIMCDECWSAICEAADPEAAAEARQDACELALRPW